MQDIKLTTEIMDLLRERAILMAMRVRWYDAEHIAQSAGLVLSVLAASDIVH